MEQVTEIIINAGFAGIAAAGFALLFNIPPRLLIAAIVCAVAGHALRSTLLASGMMIELSTLLGASLIGFLAEFFGRKQMAPYVVFAVPAIIPMVPGYFAFQSMLGMLSIGAGKAAADPVLIEQTMTYTFKTMAIVGALAAGVAMPTLLFFRRRKES